MDSNGSIYIEGGKVFISVSDSGGNCALDYGIENGGECVVSGGTVIACGGSAMAEGFDADSPQGFFMYSTTAMAGTTISLEDSLGTELLSEEIPCSFSSVVISTPELKMGDICTIEVGGIQEQITIDNTSSSGFIPTGMFGGGNQSFSNWKDSDHKGDMTRNIPSQSNDQDFADKKGMEPPDRTDIPDGERRTDRQEVREVDGRALVPDEGQVQRNGTRFPQQDWKQMYSEEDISSSNISVNTFILLGISVLTLLIGLFIAIKIKH